MLYCCRAVWRDRWIKDSYDVTEVGVGRVLKSNGGISELTLASSSRPLMLNTIGASMQNNANAQKTNKGKIKLKVY